MGTFESEFIPDSDILYYRVHVNTYNQTAHKIPKGRIVAPSAIVFQGNDLSVDWDKYSSPEKLRNRATDPEKNGIIIFIAQEIRQSDCKMGLCHSPSRKNRAHCSVCGIEAEVRVALSKIAKWSDEFPLSIQNTSASCLPSQQPDSSSGQ